MNKLVNYSSSSSDNEEPAQKKMKLPIPFEKSIENSDNPAEHQGRKRQIPHIVGNFASHVFIDCPHFYGILNEYYEKITQVSSDINIIEEPHVSLSKNFILKHHWINNLTKDLLKNLKFNAFDLKFSISNIIFLSNEDKSRHFACILVNEACHDELKKLVEATNKSLKEFELPSYYENLIFHASIFWKLTEFSGDEKKLIRKEICDFVQNENVLDSIVEKITLKTGNKIKFFNCH